MTTVLAVLGFAALFVIFGVFHAGRGGCSGCSCGDGACRKEAEHEAEAGTS